MKTAGKKILSLALAALLATGSMTAQAAGIQPEALAITLNIGGIGDGTVVGFAGQEWCVIGNSGSGVRAPSGHITLLAKSTGNPYGNVAFRTGNSSQDDPSWTNYDGRYYEGSFNLPGDYSDSTLQRRMQELATNTDTFPAKEAALITPRTLTAGDDMSYPITGGDVSGQKLWPLSYEEWYSSSYGGAVFNYGSDWWLRSPSNGTMAFISRDNSPAAISLTENQAVRPAFYLNLGSVLFTSDASGAGAKPTTAGTSLSAARAKTGAVKFTMLDNDPTNLKLAAGNTAITKATGDQVDIPYTGAVTGTNKYVSMVLTGSAGEVLYYGKLVDLAGGTGSENGTASFTVPSNLANGSYTIKLFNEEVGGDNYTDFASDPVLIPLTVQAGTDLTVNTSVVGFAGQEWWVIGDGGSGVRVPADHIMLLVKSSGNPYGTTMFRTGGDTQENQNWTYHASSSKYYEGSFNRPIDYADSTLQRRMEALAADTAFFPAKEAELITPRTLTAGDDRDFPITGDNVSNQKLWPLSYDEWNAIDSTTVRRYGTHWWFRSPLNDIGALLGDLSGVLGYGDGSVLYSYAVRPAFYLNLSSVFFTSDASGAGAKPTTVGTSLSAAEPPTGSVKFTMQDSLQTLSVTASAAQSTQSGNTLNFRYNNAKTGTNQYVSCVLKQSGAVKYYGKLADSSSNASGDLSIPLAGVADGAYKLKIFSEQANGDNYTDFAGTPVEMDLNITGGTGTVSNFSGTLLSDDAGLTTVAGQSITAVGSGTSAGSPKTAGISVANTVTSIATSDIAVAMGAAFKLYSDNGFSQDENQPVSLAEGSNNRLYIKVTAEDGITTLYYDVTVTRDSTPPPVGTAPTITTNSLPNGTVGTAYSQTLSASGDTPITWTLVSGSLPDGLSLSLGGMISGTPSSSGSFSFTVKAANGVSPDATKAFSISITSAGSGPNPPSPNPPSPDPSDTTAPTITGIAATPYGTTGAILEVTATDASLPLTYQWQVKGSWIDIPGATTARFDYSGLTPNTGYTVRVKVTDAKGNMATSQEITFKTGVAAITGLPDSYTLVKGQSVSWTPSSSGGTWSYDKDYLSMTRSGGTYTFKALKTGKTSVAYTAGGTEYVIQITVNDSTIPQTGDTGNPLSFVLLSLASLGGIGALIYIKKRRYA